MTVTHGEERKRVPERTRARLVEAAGELFREQGLEASLDAICERAGYTRGAFYVHFGSRDDLVGAVVEHALLGFLGSFVGESSDDLPAIVESFVTAMSTGALRLTPEVRVAQLLEACSRSPALRAKCLMVVLEIRERIAAAVRRSQAAGKVAAEVRPDALAEILLALVLGAQVATELGAPYDAPAVGEEIVRLTSPPASKPRVATASKRPAASAEGARGDRRRSGSVRKKDGRARRGA
ncbi:MAG: TetR/AcrR family transcriptional regulator [Deltaproteobacteria bacterium]|nr:TetR/AcrR family transcriptional regulator [Deltaproteobacteria bacterium]